MCVNKRMKTFPCCCFLNAWYGSLLEIIAWVILKTSKVAKPIWMSIRYFWVRRKCCPFWVYNFKDLQKKGFRDVGLMTSTLQKSIIMILSKRTTLLKYGLLKKHQSPQFPNHNQDTETISPKEEKCKQNCRFGGNKWLPSYCKHLYTRLC